VAFRNALGAQLLCPRLPLTFLGPKLEVAIGLDETVASARISCYEMGQHEPPYQTAQQLSTALNIPKVGKKPTFNQYTCSFCHHRAF
jgi:hypothetical protein